VLHCEQFLWRGIGSNPDMPHKKYFVVARCQESAVSTAYGTRAHDEDDSIDGPGLSRDVV
jgi:hypothetical protein